MKDFEAFRNDLGEQESNNNYKAVNRYGYLGRYQFGKARLLDLGYSIDNYGKNTRPILYARSIKITKGEFLNNPKLQDELFIKHVKDLKETIKKQYARYLNKTHRGIYLTLSGLVAGAHLVGLGGLRQWIRGGEVKDGNGVKVETYIKKFAGYDI